MYLDDTQTHSDVDTYRTAVLWTFGMQGSAEAAKSTGGGWGITATSIPTSEGWGKNIVPHTASRVPGGWGTASTAFLLSPSEQYMYTASRMPGVAGGWGGTAVARLRETAEAREVREAMEAAAAREAAEVAAARDRQLAYDLEEEQLKQWEQQWCPIDSDTWPLQWLAFVQKALEHGPWCPIDVLSQAQHVHIEWKQMEIEKDIDAWDYGWPSSLMDRDGTEWDDTVNQMWRLARFDEYPERKCNWVYWLQVLEAIDDTPDRPVA